MWVSSQGADAGFSLGGWFTRSVCTAALILSFRISDESLSARQQGAVYFLTFTFCLTCLIQKSATRYTCATIWSGPRVHAGQGLATLTWPRRSLMSAIIIVGSLLYLQAWCHSAFSKSKIILSKLFLLMSRKLFVLCKSTYSKQGIVFKFVLSPMNRLHAAGIFAPTNEEFKDPFFENRKHIDANIPV